LGTMTYKKLVKCESFYSTFVETVKET